MLQTVSPESRRGQMLERIESRRIPPRETAREMLREGDRQITDTRSGLDTIASELHHLGATPEESEQLKTLEAELDSAWEDLNADISSAVQEPAKPEAVSGVYEKPAAPTEEELDWEIPEVAITPTEQVPETIEAKNELPEGPKEQTNAAIKEVMEGRGDPAVLSELMKTEEGRWEAEDRIFEIANELNAAGQTPAETLERLSRLARADAHLLDRAKTGLTESIGSTLAERLLTDTAYRTEMLELQTALRENISGPESPMFCSETGLRNLIAIKETLGMHGVAMAKTLDLRGYDKGLEERTTFTRDSDGNYEDILRVVDLGFDEEGGIARSQVDAAFSYETIDENGNATNEFAQIHRSFSKEMKESKEGTKKEELTVKHELFELPPSIKGSGVAAEVTRRSLEVYDQMGADAITLHADIEQGGYAWASYGYGWDEAEMDPSNIETLVVMSRGNIESAFEEVGLLEDPRVQAMLQKLDDAIDHPEAVTPQMLASMGKDGPLLRKGETGNWYTEEGYEKAVADGTEIGESTMLKGKLHAGKIALIGSDWYGRIDLKADGPQAGANRALLEKKINRTKPV